ncbi:hypothetical protein ALMP_85110 [Streptomyces sp. A012304]|nr:hypothetical protein ALMP_85110 [Streptomyces sp. A012304]
MQTDRTAQRHPGVGEPLHAERVREREHQAGEVADGGAGGDQVRRRAAVPRQVPADHPVCDGQLGRDLVPQGVGGAQGGAEQERGSGIGPLGTVVEQFLGQRRSSARSVRAPAEPV